VALISGLLYCSISPCSLTRFVSAGGRDWCVGSRPAGLQCVNKRFIHCKLISRYVTGLPKYAATKHLRSVDLITSLSQQDLKSVACTSGMCRCSNGWSNELFFLT